VRHRFASETSILGGVILAKKGSKRVKKGSKRVKIESKLGSKFDQNSENYSKRSKRSLLRGGQKGSKRGVQKGQKWGPAYSDSQGFFDPDKRGVFGVFLPLNAV